MDNMENDKKLTGLFSEFPPVTREQWEERILQDLKGADYEKKLVWRTAEGISVKPYYRAEDLESIKQMFASLPGQYPYVRGTNAVNNQWLIAQDIETSDISKANYLAKDATRRGADAVLLNVSEVNTAKEMSALLDGIELDKVTLLFNSSPSYENLLLNLDESLISSGYDSTTIKGVFDFDPLSYVLLNGNFYNSEEGDLLEGAQLLKDAARTLKQFRVLSVNGQFFHNAGSTLVQELAFALASGNEYLSWYTTKGFTADEVASKMTFHFATGSNYFMEIAKLRAARLLWAQIVNAYKPESQESLKMYIHSMTSGWNKSIYDPFVNMLRTTTEAMSAALGNADIITVLPFDVNYQEPDDLSLRMARNQQIILKEESNLDKVIDPAAGSYYIDNLTASLVDAAWKLFLQVEEKGGMLAAIKEGFVQDEIAASAKKKKDDIANRRTIVLGTNQHPNLNERMLEKLQVEPDAEDGDEETEDDYINGSDNEETVGIPFRRPQYKTIEISRGTDEFEDLRLATEIWENEGNKRPAVFMLTYGNPAMRKARAAFSSSFFGVAGYRILDNAGFNTTDEGIRAAIDSGSEIVVLCSSDEEYAESAADITRSIKASKPDVIIVVAGYPKEITESLKLAGVDEFIHVKSNLLTTLYGFQQKLEVML
jgi:methylmalonyl-CoA mutase